jgi:hypothetical protein
MDLNQRFLRRLAQYISRILPRLMMRSRRANRCSQLLWDENSVFLIRLSALHLFHAHFSETSRLRWCPAVDDFGVPTNVLVASSSSFHCFFSELERRLVPRPCTIIPFHYIWLLFLLSFSQPQFTTAPINGCSTDSFFPLCSPFLHTIRCLSGFRSRSGFRDILLPRDCIKFSKSFLDLHRLSMGFAALHVSSSA